MNYIISKKLEKQAFIVKNAYYFLLKAKTKNGTGHAFYAWKNPSEFFSSIYIFFLHFLHKVIDYLVSCWLSTIHSEALVPWNTNFV